MVGLIATEAMVFAILLAAYFFLRASSPAWPLDGIPVPELRLALPFSFVLWGSSIPIFYAESAIRRGRLGGFRVALFVSFAMGAAFLAYTISDFRARGRRDGRGDGGRRARPDRHLDQRRDGDDLLAGERHRARGVQAGDRGHLFRLRVGDDGRPAADEAAESGHDRPGRVRACLPCDPAPGALLEGQPQVLGRMVEMLDDLLDIARPDRLPSLAAKRAIAERELHEAMTAIAAPLRTSFATR